jgi:MraZ protein
VGAAPATPPQATPPVYSALPPRAPVPVETEPVPPLTRVGALVPAPSPAPLPGPTYRVRKDGETLEEVAQKTLGSSKRWLDIHRLNPGVGQEGSLLAGMMLHLPADARIVGDEPIKPLPSLHPDRPHSKPRVVLPLTGTYLCEVDEHQVLHLPRALREQLTNPETVLVSPGPDKCLWLTDQTHLERLGKRLEESSAPENEVRIFKRLYFAQIEKLPVNTGGRVVISRRMATFAGLSRKVVLVGIGDHFEVWDEARWRVYTKEQSENTQARLAN